MSPSLEILTGEVLEMLRRIPDASCNSCVTDPPYEIGFMAKKWDSSGVAFRSEVWREVLRVLRPGAYLTAFGGTRTYHRTVCAIEDAGFEIRDQIGWIYAQGFPKSLDVGKLDPRWEGLGTALKPAFEPICIARKPIEGTVLDNLNSHNAGALNIEASRVPFAGPDDESEAKDKNQHEEFDAGPRSNAIFSIDSRPRENYDAPGRFPANIIHDGSPEALSIFPQSDSRGHFPALDNAKGALFKSEAGTGGHRPREGLDERDMDVGSAARFFFCAKVTPSERLGNDWPTVKPLALMRYLVKLVTPPGGKCLDCFTGSGTTNVACLELGFDSIAIDKDPHAIALTRRRCMITPGFRLA